MSVVTAVELDAVVLLVEGLLTSEAAVGVELLEALNAPDALAEELAAGSVVELMDDEVEGVWLLMEESVEEELLDVGVDVLAVEAGEELLLAVDIEELAAKAGAFELVSDEALLGRESEAATEPAELGAELAAALCEIAVLF
jgi:hypothetical protein